MSQIEKSPGSGGDSFPPAATSVSGAWAGAVGARDAQIVASARRLLGSGPRAVVDVLAALNARTRFRFTGLYRVEPPILRNLVLFDRENPQLRAGGVCCALDDTYCALVASGGAPFTTADAPNDPRLTAHAARTSVLSYVGVPVRGPSGRVEGTLCHFDARPRLAPAGEMAVLEAVAALLSDALQIDPRDASS